MIYDLKWVHMTALNILLGHPLSDNMHSKIKYYFNPKVHKSTVSIKNLLKKYLFTESGAVRLRMEELLVADESVNCFDKYIYSFSNHQIESSILSTHLHCLLMYNSWNTYGPKDEFLRELIEELESDQLSRADLFERYNLIITTLSNRPEINKFNCFINPRSAEDTLRCSKIIMIKMHRDLQKVYGHTL
jgi:hypothetical protein